jgi:hypothetical protein
VPTSSTKSRAFVGGSPPVCGDANCGEAHTARGRPLSHVRLCAKPHIACDLAHSQADMSMSSLSAREFLAVEQGRLSPKYVNIDERRNVQSSAWCGRKVSGANLQRRHGAQREAQLLAAL